jgi:methyl-accepting chemotaxis protein
MNQLLHAVRSLSIRTKLTTLCILILIYTFIIMGTQETTRLTGVLEGEALVKAQSDLQTGSAIMDLKYPGAWHVKEGQLYKGDVLMNDNYEFVDMISELTDGNTATLFLGDTRVTTNVMVDGARAVGTKVSDVVAEKVLQRGETYLGQANVAGHTYQSAYMPIKDVDGTIIGIWYMGAPDSSVRIKQIKDDIAKAVAIEAGVILVIALLLFFFLSRPMINRMKTSAHSLQVIANGDFTQKEIQVKSNDETGVLIKSMNRMTRELRAVLIQVKDTSLQVAASSEQLTASTDQTSKAAEHISSAIQEVASGSETQMSSIMQANVAVKEISRGMDQVLYAIESMAQLSASANEDAKFGTQTVTQTIEQMNTIQKTVKETAVVIDSLEGKSKEIDQIIEVITQIASQTHLLALNAAIEAARAGESGMGFAVVAAEVRKLADQSVKFADEIRELIGQVQAESSKAVRFMNIGTQVVQQGMDQVKQSGVAFDAIVSSIEEISTQSQAATAIVQEVNANSDQMVSMMDQVSLITQQSSDHTHTVAASVEEQTASMEEVSASATHLGSMAEELQEQLGKFKV